MRRLFRPATFLLPLLAMTQARASSEMHDFFNTSLGSNITHVASSPLSGEFGFLSVTADGTGTDITEKRFSRNGTLIFTKTFTSGPNTIDTPTGYAIDDLGNSVVCGSKPSASGTNRDFLAFAREADGDIRWSYAYGGSAGLDDEARGLFFDGVRAYITGYTAETGQGKEMHTVQITLAGNVDWERRTLTGGTNNEVGNAITVNPSGDVFAIGTTDSFGTGQDYFVAKYTSNGTAQGTFRFDGPITGDDVALHGSANNNGLFITGTSLSANGDDIVTVKVFANSMTKAWDHRINGTGNAADRPVGIFSSFAQNLILVAASIRNAIDEDFALLRYDLDGNPLTTTKSDSGLDDVPVAAAWDSDFNTYIIGTSIVSGHQHDWRILKLNKSGVAVNGLIFNSTGNGDDFAAGIDVDNNQNVVAAGKQGGATQGHFRKYIRGLLNFNIVESSAIAGVVLNAQATISEFAPDGGLALTVTSSAGANPPPTVTVQAGNINQSFQIPTNGVDADATTQVTVAFDGNTRTDTVLVKAANTYQDFLVSPTGLFETQTATGTVSMNGFAGPSGKNFTITDNSSAISTPAGVTIAPNTSSANFTIGTSHVTTATTRSVSATLNGVTKTRNLSIYPGLKSFAFSPAEVSGGDSVSGNFATFAPAPIIAVITITNSSSAILLPQTVNIGANTSTLGMNVNTAPVGADAVRVVTATLGTISKSSVLKLTVHPKIANISFSPSTIEGGDVANCTATLTSVSPPGGRTSTGSDNTSAIAFFGTFFPEGQSSKSFVVTTSEVTSTVTRTCTMTLGGASKTANLTLTPRAKLQAVNLSTNSIKGGQSLNGTVVLNRPTLPGLGKTAFVTDNSSSIETPGSVTVDGGLSQKGFVITTSPVGTSATRQITATLEEITKTANLTLTP